MSSQDTHVLNETIRKLWVRIIPFVFILYVIAFLDRVNIGFAEVPMHQLLGFSYSALGLASGIFFIGYFIFQMPGTYLVDKIGAKVVIAIFLAGWGVFGILVGTVTNVMELYIYRFIEGFMEGAFFPGVIYYLSIWFPQKWRAQAVALFMMAIPVSEIINGPLAGYIITTIGWRWLFYIEGLLALIFAPIAYIYMTNRPSEAAWLSPEEKNALISVLNKEAEEAAKKVKQSIGSGFGNMVNRTSVYVRVGPSLRHDAGENPPHRNTINNRNNRLHNCNSVPKQLLCATHSSNIAHDGHIGSIRLLLEPPNNVLNRQRGGGGHRLR